MLRAHAEKYAPIYGQEKLVCDLCGFSSYNVHDMTMHKRKSHPSKVYACNTCNGEFVTSGVFWNHYLTHTDNKPFKCLLCDYRTNRKGNVALHVRKMHKDIPENETYNYVIKDSALCFDKMSSEEFNKLYTFKEVDPSEQVKKRKLKPGMNRVHKCSLCDYGSPTRAHVAKHIESMHKEKLANGNSAYDLIMQNEPGGNYSEKE